MKDPVQDQIKEYLSRMTWDFPIRPDEMRIPSYDINGNPTQVDYYLNDILRFTHKFTWDINGNLTIKKLIII